jgi:hypothetical protein
MVLIRSSTVGSALTVERNFVPEVWDVVPTGRLSLPLQKYDVDQVTSAFLLFAVPSEVASAAERF